MEHEIYRLHPDENDADYHPIDARTALRQRNLRQAAIEREREKLEERTCDAAMDAVAELEKQNENKTTTGN